MMARGKTRPIDLIVNADDFGYFDGVSRGIVEAARHGTVTATGVMANGPALERWSAALRAVGETSVGVHLNATLGVPLTAAMRNALDQHANEFPPLATFLKKVVTGRLALDLIEQEWRAQIRRCLDLDLRPEFLNSHEHVHMLPPLYRLVLRLASEFGIRFVRQTGPEWRPKLSAGSVIRGVAFSLMHLPVRSTHDQPVTIGVNPSGRLTLEYCDFRFPRLAGGHSYELMCHPGHRDDAAALHPALTRYHDWEGEFAVLTDPRFRTALEKWDIRLRSYKTLPADGTLSPQGNCRDIDRTTGTAP